MLVKIQVEAEYKDNTGEYQYIYFDIETDVNAVDNGIGNYEFWGAKGKHKSIEIEVEEKPLIECITTNHSPKDLAIIHKYIAENESDIINDIINKYKKL